MSSISATFNSNKINIRQNEYSKLQLKQNKANKTKQNNTKQYNTK